MDGGSLEADPRVLKALSSPAGEKPVKPGYLPFPQTCLLFPPVFTTIFHLFRDPIFVFVVESSAISSALCSSCLLNYCEQHFFLSSHYIK